MVQVIQKRSENKIQKEKTFLTDQLLKKMKQRSEEEYAAALAQEAGYAYVDLNIMPINTDYLRIVPHKTAIKYKTGVFLRRDRVIHAVINDVKNTSAQEVVETIAQENGWEVKWYLVSRASLKRLHEQYKSFSLFENIDRMKLDLSEDDFQKLQERFSSILALKKNVLDMPTTQVVALIVAGAVSLRASDIHFEPQNGDQVRMRYRLDGVLQDVGHLPLEVYKFIISRVKMMGKMKLNVRKSAQDGRFSFFVEMGEEKKRKIDIRASILPGRFGETIVLRILDQSKLLLNIANLGMEGFAYQQYLEELKKTNGMIITTGPTGSGKTTLLYSSLDRLNVPGVKIITIEDPVEYEVENISQTNVSEENGYTFSSGLRSIVRQDPDIILVGEIRDEETADIAVQSSLTGHLVLTTLHTNSAPGAIPRLINLGVKPSMISSAVNAFVAQRLVRRLCENCKESYTPAQKTLDMIMRLVSIISPKANVDIPKDVKKLYRSKGCPECNYSGYKGRIGIFEVMFLNEEIVNQIEDLASEDDLARSAIENGMVTMTQDGILKALRGITSMEEVWRVGGQFRFLEEVYERLMMQYLRKTFFVPYSVFQDLQQVSAISDFQKVVDKGSSEELLLNIIGYAVIMRAGDVHIEPEDENVRIRFRIDGVLQTIARISPALYTVVLSKIKLLSSLKTEEQVGLQDSRFTVISERKAVGEEESIDIRVSIILGGYGETAVLRFLNIGAQAENLAGLGMREEVRHKLEEAIKIPNGIILSTGPTGSGKSTTLYSILSELNTSSRKIMTVEDPIEYRIEGLLQTQVDEEKGYSFSNALRSLLRQNPDILFVGEIRDEETAQISVQASLTGHLVFSTLHTNDAVSAIQRLINMNISSKDIATSVSLIMAQRLVRKLCDCKEKREATEEEKAEMKSFYKEYREHTQEKELPDFSFIYEPKGCEKCRGLGYNGMIMISEAVNMQDKDLREGILQGASTSDIYGLAIQKGMTPMIIDGIDKVLAGVTSLEDVRRVTEL